jgi:plastocyanin
MFIRWSDYDAGPGVPGGTHRSRPDGGVPVTRSLALVAAAAVLAPALLHPAAAQAPPEIALAIEQHRFRPDEIRVKAGAPFVLVITNKDQGPEEFESQALRIEKVIPGGKTLRVRVPALKAGTYPFVGEYHEQTAQGRIVAE